MAWSSGRKQRFSQIEYAWDLQEGEYNDNLRVRKYLILKELADDRIPFYPILSEQVLERILRRILKISTVKVNGKS